MQQDVLYLDQTIYSRYTDIDILVVASETDWPSHQIEIRFKGPENRHIENGHKLRSLLFNPCQNGTLGIEVEDEEFS